MFLCIGKINSAIHFFHKILHFKEFCNLIAWQHFGSKLKNQNFARYEIGVEISTTTEVSILDYSQEKLMTRFFKKSKKTYFGAILSPSCPNSGKNEFSRKKGSVSFEILQLSTTVHSIS